MVQYSLFNSIIESNIDLGLTATCDHTPDLSFQLLQERVSETAAWQAFNHFWLPDGEFWLSLSKCESGYRFHFPELGDFEVSNDGSQICCFPCLHTPLHTIIHLFLDQVLPTVLSHRRNIVLHASGVVISDKANIFLGDSQTGKSTLVASLSNDGLLLLTDDCVLLNDSQPITAIGGFPTIRLWPDSLDALTAKGAHHEAVSHYSDKRRLHARHNFCNTPVPIQNLYLLSRPQDTDSSQSITIKPLRMRERIAGLLSHSFRLDITDRERNAREFEMLTRLAEKLPMYRLSYPRRYDKLPAVRDAILAHVEETRCDE